MEKTTKEQALAILKGLKAHYENGITTLKYADMQHSLAEHLYSTGQLRYGISRGGYGPMNPEKELCFYASPTAFSKLQREIDEESRAHDADVLKLHIPTGQNIRGILFVAGCRVFETDSVEGDDVILGTAEWDACDGRMTCVSRFDELVQGD